MYRSKKKGRSSHIDQRIVTCDRCQTTMPMKGGNWVINGAGQLLCYGTMESCFETVFKLRSDNDRKRSADPQEEN